MDGAGQVYIADRHNQRIRRVDSAGVISTLAGTATGGFSGGFSSESGSAAAAGLATPSGVAVDASGNVLIADTGNQRIRQVRDGVIATIVGTGDQGFGGDGGLSTTALLNAPRAVATDATGNLVVADTLNGRVRSSALPVLTFIGGGAAGVASAPQSITITNSGSGSLTVTGLLFSGAFAAVSGGSCPSLPMTLAAGGSCTQSIAFTPTASGASNGSVVVEGTGVVPQTILLTGSSSQTTTTLGLASSAAATFVNQTVTFTATVTPSGAGTPTGTVFFYDGGTLLATAQPLLNNMATLSLSTLAAGTHTITAVYSGDANFTGSTSSAIAELIEDFDFTITPNPSNPGGSTQQTVAPGAAATFSFTVQPTTGASSFPIALAATGLPAGATATFTPQTLTLRAGASSFTMTIQTAASTSGLSQTRLFGGGAMALALLLLPFPLRRKAKHLHALTMLALIAAGAMCTTLTGCGSGSGFFGQSKSQKTYTIQVVGKATGAAGATLQHITVVQLTLQ